MNEDAISRAALLERMTRIRDYCKKRGYGDGAWEMPIMFVTEAPSVQPQVGHGSPCDLCRYNPPSSCDGKPCTMCPAEAKMDGGEDDADN